MDFLNKKEFDIIVKPRSSFSKISFKENNGETKIIINVISPPVDNKANEEVVKLFKKTYKIKVEVIKGLKSRKKRLRRLDI